MKIYKYSLPNTRGEHRLMCYPIESILKIDVVDNVPHFWAVVNESRRIIEHVVTVYFTGDEDRHFNVVGSEFIGTAIFNKGSYVLHYYIDEL